VTSEHLHSAVRIEVHDQGKGVPAEQRSKLFNRFITPGNEGDKSQLGLGLGLSVVKAIVEAQQGAVGFRESESGGAVFWITLPLVEGNNT
jgi:two-component system sensor histidine kinase SaeS